MGTLRGNPDDTLRDITLENIDLKPADSRFEPGEVKNFVSKNVLLNGVPYNSTAATE